MSLHTERGIESEVLMNIDISQKFHKRLLSMSALKQMKAIDEHVQSVLPKGLSFVRSETRMINVKTPVLVLEVVLLGKKHPPKTLNI